MKFPIYRKYQNGKSYFRINSISDFEELRIMNSFYSLISYKAQILPDRVLIEDMIHQANNHWIESTQEEFESKLQYCHNHLKNMS